MDDDDINAARRVIDAEAERRRRERFGAIGGPLRSIREALGASVEDAAYQLRMSPGELRNIENGMVKFDAFVLADHLHSLLEARGVPRRGASCLCPLAPHDHEPACRLCDAAAVDGSG